MNEDARTNLANIISQLQEKVRASSGTEVTVVKSSKEADSSSSSSESSVEEPKENPYGRNILMIKQRLSENASRPLRKEYEEEVVFQTTNDEQPQESPVKPQLPEHVASVLRSKQDKAIQDLQTKLEARKSKSELHIEQTNGAPQMIYRRSKFESDPQQTVNPGSSTVHVLKNGVSKKGMDVAEAGPPLSEPVGEKTKTMVNVVPKEPITRISLASIDSAKDEYMRQFANQTGPVSEKSPIKNDLDNMINTFTKQNNFNSLPRTNTIQRTEEKDVVFQKEDISTPVRKEKPIVTPTPSPRGVNGSVDTEQDTLVDIPNTTVNTKPKIEYRATRQQPAPAGGPIFRMSEWADSGRDYDSIRKEVGL